MPRLSVTIGLVFVLLSSCASLAYEVRKDNRWTPDGYLYARMMLVDAGRSEEAARAEASRFFLSTPAAQNPQARDLYGRHPPAWYDQQYPLFRARPLYPELAAVAYGRLGFRAMKDLAAASMVIAALTLYVLLLLVAPPWLAACGALAGIATPVARDAATLASTDGLGLAWWTIGLTATAFYARHPTRTALAVSVLAAVLLALTRPAIWLPLGAAAGLLVAAYRTSDSARRRAATTLFLAQVAVAGGALLFTKAVHGAGFITLMRWSYDWQTTIHGPYVGHGILAWYAGWLVRGLVIEPATVVERGVPLLALAIAAVGVQVRRRDAIVPVLLGAACAAPFAIIANPPDFRRALELPLTPIVLTALVAAVAAVLPATGVARQHADA